MDGGGAAYKPSRNITAYRRTLLTIWTCGVLSSERLTLMKMNGGRAHSRSRLSVLAPSAADALASSTDEVCTLALCVVVCVLESGGYGVGERRGGRDYSKHVRFGNACRAQTSFMNSRRGFGAAIMYLPFFVYFSHSRRRDHLPI